MDESPDAPRGESHIPVRFVNRVAFVAAGFALAACASPGMPPGGPVDTQAPQIIRIVPDSGKTGTTPPHVIFRFDEVVNERPAAVQSLTSLFLISPRDGEPRVEWHRDELEIRPRHGWRRNTAYTITMLPGLSDLRGNTRNTGAVTMFSTGTAIPASRIVGTLFNWSEARPVTRALIEARPRSDTSIVYVAGADSIGNFVVQNLPSGLYLVRGIADDNSNRGLDRGEAWDTTAVSLTDTSRVELYAFVHDSLGTRLQNVSMRDSVTLDLSFSNPLSLAQPVTPGTITVRAPDSTAIAVQSVALPPPDTSAIAKRIHRPIPSRTLTVRLSTKLRPLTLYRVRVVDARNLMGIPRTSETTFTTPAAQPPAPAATPPVAPPSPVKR